MLMTYHCWGFWLGLGWTGLGGLVNGVLRLRLAANGRLQSLASVHYLLLSRVCIPCLILDSSKHSRTIAPVVLHIHVNCTSDKSLDSHSHLINRLPFDEFTTSPFSNHWWLCPRDINLFFPPYLSPHSNEPCDGLFWFLFPIQSTSCCTAWWAGSILCMTPAASVGRFQLSFSSYL